MIYLIEILAALSVLGSIFYLLTKGHWAFKNLSKKWLALASLLILSGFLLLLLPGKEILYKIETRNWPSADGTIVSSKVVGLKAIRPEIVYKYTVNDIEYDGITSLQMPPFGFRNGKRDISTKMVGLYNKGDTVTVKYDPEQHTLSYLSTRADVGIFLQLGFGMVLFPIGLCLSLLVLVKNK